MAHLNQAIGASTRSLHADDELNVVTDVAPPLHVSTTFRYSDNPDELVPLTDLSGVCHSSLINPFCAYWPYSDIVNLYSSMIKKKPAMSIPVSPLPTRPVSKSFYRHSSTAKQSAIPRGYPP